MGWSKTISNLLLVLSSTLGARSSDLPGAHGIEGTFLHKFVESLDRTFRNLFQEDPQSHVVIC